jgi:hypothetical protein
MDEHWLPLERRIGKKKCVGFMYMGRMNGVHRYKHGITRTVLVLDDSGKCYRLRPDGRFAEASFEVELFKIECLLAEVGETLETSYDDAYIARKGEALRKSGLLMIVLEMEPEDTWVH